jgi:hypothetical protein
MTLVTLGTVTAPPAPQALQQRMMHNVVSVDGFIATDDQVGPLFDWYF